MSHKKTLRCHETDVKTFDATIDKRELLGRVMDALRAVELLHALADAEVSAKARRWLSDQALEDLREVAAMLGRE